MQDIVILSAARTPTGSFLGALSPLAAPALGAAAVRAAVERAGVEPERVQQVVLGNVLQAGLGQAPARQAGIFAGLPKACGAVTVHKVCGSGMRALMDLANGVRVGEWDLGVAGGMESMSNAPHLLEGARRGLRMGPAGLADSMLKDGLWDPYSDRHMGQCAEACATKYSFTRAEQDAYSLQSYRRAQAAVEAGRFADELVAVSVPQKRGDPVLVEHDEEPFAAPLDKMAGLRPAFDKSGTITAANASKINDGAAALLVTSEEKAEELGCSPVARLVAQASAAQEPEWFTTAPALAVRLALGRAGLKATDIARWEINEAFAVVPMAAIRDLELDPKQVNCRGGAISLGHPIGASGARVVVTLVHTLVQEKQRFGCAVVCIGSGEATCVVVENLTL